MIQICFTRTKKNQRRICGEIFKKRINTMKMDKLMMDTSEKFETPTDKFETKFSKISKSFSIENLIAKRSKPANSPESLPQDEPIQQNYPFLPFPNFPIYNPCWAGYLSQAQVPNASNLFANGQPNDKLAHFLDTTECKDKISELLFNPLAALSQAAMPHPSAFFQQQHHDQFLLNNKFKDNYFLNDFYNNYFLNENNKQLMSARNGAASANNTPNKSKKNAGKCGVDNNVNNFSNFSNFSSESLKENEHEIDVDGDSLDGNNETPLDYCEENGNQVDESHDGSCSDLSLTMSPNELSQHKLDKGMIYFNIKISTQQKAS